MKKLLIIAASTLFPLLAYARYRGSEFDLQGFLIIIAISFIISVIITRLVFSIPTFLKYQKVQTLLLIKIAKQEKISDNDLDTILDIIEERSTPAAKNSDNLRDIYLKISPAANNAGNQEE